MTFTEAVQLAENGDNAGFDFLYQETYKSKYYLALQYTKDKALAEDVMQNAYIRAFKALDSLENPESFPAWFGTIVVTTSLNELKRQKRYQADSLDNQLNEDGEEYELEIEDIKIENQPELAYTREETKQLVHELMDSLSDEQRFCVLMFHIAGQSIKEIADALQVSENTVKSRLNYGRNNIKKKAEELQKKGYKLYSIAPLPLLLWLLRKEGSAFAYGAEANAATAALQTKIWNELQKDNVLKNTAGTTKSASKVSSITSKLGFLTTTTGKIAAAIATVAVIGSAVTATILNGKTTINLNDYVDVTFSGYNTVGNIEINSETWYDSVIRDNWEAFGLSEQEGNEGFYSENLNDQELRNCISVVVDEQDGLADGDSVTVQWDVDDEKLKELKKNLHIKFEYSDMEMTVDGLEDAQSWDPFENMEYSFDGMSSAGYISFNSISEVPDLKYSMDGENGGFSNGDTITVTLTAPDNQDVTEYCMENGKIPTVLTKEIVVEGLDAYVTDLSQISVDTLQKMDKNIQDKVAANAAKTWVWELSDMEFLGNYLLYSTENLQSNYLYYIYKITELQESTGDTVSYYYYGAYKNVILLGDGTVSVDLSDVDFPSGGISFSGGPTGEAFIRDKQHFVGYEDLDSLYEKQVTEKGNGYTCVSTVTE